MMEGFHNWYRVEMQSKLTAAQYLEGELSRLSAQIAFDDVQCALLDKNKCVHNTRDVRAVHQDHIDIVKSELEKLYNEIDKLNTADKMASK